MAANTNKFSMSSFEIIYKMVVLTIREAKAKLKGP
jgi:hypothetical protein